MSPNDILRLAGINAEITPVAIAPCVPEIPKNYSEVKCALVNAIEHYNHECERNISPNAKQVYNELISQLDQTLGFVINNQCEQACKLFNTLDSKSKQLIIDSHDCVAEYFGCCKPHEVSIVSVLEPVAPEEEEQCTNVIAREIPAAVEQPPQQVRVISRDEVTAPKEESEECEKSEESEEVEASAEAKEVQVVAVTKPTNPTAQKMVPPKKAEESEEKVVKSKRAEDRKAATLAKMKKKRVAEAALPTILDEPKASTEEKEPTVRVPANVIADIKTRISELDDGHNHEYTSHLSGYDVINFKYTLIKNTLTTLLDYLTSADASSIMYATTYLTSLESATKQYVPASVWKYLAVDYTHSTSIKDRFAVLKKVKF